MKFSILIYLLALLMGLPGRARAQGAAAACGNGRYVDDQFGNAAPTTVLFGQNFARNYATGTDRPVSLYMDVYEPADDRVGDPTAQRPVIILAFGGAFVAGTRTDADIVDICKAFARKGYVTASIDYRILEPDFANLYAVRQNQQYLVDEVIRAASDMKAAVRYFKRDATTTNAFRIDPTKIFVGGFSAGAITALQVGYTDTIIENPITTQAYLDNGGLEGNTDLTPPLQPTYNASGLAGIVNIAGAVSRTRILSVGNPPLYSAQGTNDQTVPYNEGVIEGTMFTLSGSYRLKQRADSVGITNQLHPVVGGNHGSPASEPDRTQIINEAAAFLQALICPATPLPVTLVAFEGQRAAGTCATTLRWRTASELNSQGYEVQRSADGRAFTTLGTVPSRNSPSGATYSFEAGPAASAAYYRLRMVDADQTATYSPVVSVAACAPGRLALLPNPAHGQVTVSNLPAELCQVQVYTVAGQLVAQATGSSTVLLELAGLPAGLYLVQAATAGGAPLGQARLVKQ